LAANESFICNDDLGAIRNHWAALLLLTFGVAGALFVGLSSTALQDEDREWLARAAAKLLLFCTTWIAACTVVLLIPAGLLVGAPGRKA